MSRCGTRNDGSTFMYRREELPLETDVEFTGVIIVMENRNACFPLYRKALCRPSMTQAA